MCPLQGNPASFCRTATFESTILPIVADSLKRTLGPGFMASADVAEAHWEIQIRTFEALAFGFTQSVKPEPKIISGPRRALWGETQAYHRSPQSPAASTLGCNG
ncbi:predicted protein [Histoplasma capsulatum G186AR]|uniref:Uncharacterized protein n=1 Tax=Ajellomyces capsulatus (strain G186AR / H82 / ATCC MYA-2454 / RMSCC 2432) TaxID=447093 RepID=C0P140_AJECG|nr:uncharacterized protein HCBG_09120 [Histoplasma capsulatum G186AR]EEH02676.1 predicted protein [Histoplasma capsulatum G186AR]